MDPHDILDRKRKRDNNVLQNSKHFKYTDSVLASEKDSLKEQDVSSQRYRETWKRSAPRFLDPAIDDITLQQIDCDYTVDEKASEFSNKFGGDVSKQSKAPLVRIFGCTEEGNSILLNVHGFFPYFYIAVPRHGGEVDDITLCKSLQIGLNQAIAGRVNSSEVVENYVLSIDIVEKESLMYYHVHKSSFFKIVLALPKHLATARDFLETTGINIPGIGHRIFQTYDSKLPFALRFMVDLNITGMGWLRLPAKKWIMSLEPRSICQLEVDCYYEDIEPMSIDGKWSKIAPLRILSFDIECFSEDNTFPVPEVNPIIQISNIVRVYGSNEEIIRNVFVLGSCTPIIGADVRVFDDESEILKAWKDFILESDPDVIIGYNILNFDIPYLFGRAKALKIHDFGFMSRMGNSSEVRIKQGNFSSRAYGSKDTKEISMYGRLFFDMLQVIQREFKLRSYTLNSVSNEFLLEQKEDVPYYTISKLQKGSPEDRHRLASYCIKDAYLPMKLLDKLMCLVNYIEMARVAGVPFSYLLQRGQTIKVLAQLYKYANKEGFVIPYYKMSKQEMSNTFEGAIVIPPLKGFYDVPIVTLDFSSLYPTIMMAYNLCYSTLLSPSAIENMSPDDYIKSPAGHYFVKSHKRVGILSKILQELISNRSKAKKEIALTTDPSKIAALNARQLAFKLSANSIYGFTGFTLGSLPCLEVSSSITAFGRDMIDLTRNTIINEYSIKNGFENDALVIYGDTDSVMIQFGKNLKEAMEFGPKAAKFVSSKFPPPISLEFEKVYFPYLLINKKRYAGVLWTKMDKYDKLDMKGIETVRRDNCLLVKRVVDTCLRYILIERDIDGAIQYCKSTLTDLLMNRLDISMLVITKALSKKEADYKGKQAHVELNKRIEKRGEGNSYHTGDRIPYVIRRGNKSDITADRAEDPIYVLQNNIPLDTQFYVDMLSRPLIRIFSPILANPEDVLLSGVHMNEISIPTPKVGGIIGFTKPKPSCIGCKAILDADEKVLCKHCKDQAPIFYMKKLQALRQRELEYSRLWTQCQNCQGSFYQEVLCKARDCPIFYMRTKVQMDLLSSRKQLEVFNTDFDF